MSFGGNDNKSELSGQRSKVRHKQNPTIPDVNRNLGGWCHTGWVESPIAYSIHMFDENIIPLTNIDPVNMGLDDYSFSKNWWFAGSAVVDASHSVGELRSIVGEIMWTDSSQ